MQPAQRTAILVDVSYDPAKGAKLFLGTNDEYLVGYGMRLHDGMVDHHPSAHFQEGFILAHARAFPSGDDESGDVWHAKLISHIPQVFIGICADRGYGKLAALNSLSCGVT